MRDPYNNSGHTTRHALILGESADYSSYCKVKHPQYTEVIDKLRIRRVMRQRQRNAQKIYVYSVHLQDWGAFDESHRAQSIPAPIMRHRRDQGQNHCEDLWRNERRWWRCGGSRWTQVPVEASFKFSKNASPSGKPTPRSSRLCYPPSLARIPSGSVALPDSVGKATKLERGQRWAVLGRLLMMAPSFLSFTNPSCQPSPPHPPRIQTLCLFSTLP